jgi:predicted small metal-binding protein
MKESLGKTVMVKLSCKESGLDCDYVAEGKTEGEVLRHISEHAVSVHNMRVEDIYEKNVSAAFLCQSIGKMASTESSQKRD